MTAESAPREASYGLVQGAAPPREAAPDRYASAQLEQALASISAAIELAGRQYAASALASARSRFSRHDPIAASYRRRDAASQAQLLRQGAWAAGARVSAQEQRARRRRKRNQRGMI